MLLPLKGSFAIRVATFRQPTVAYVQVVGPSTVYLAKDRETLEYPTPAGRQGLALVAGDGVKKLEWKGALWALGSEDGALLSVELPGSY